MLTNEELAKSITEAIMKVLGEEGLKGWEPIEPEATKGTTVETTFNGMHYFYCHDCAEVGDTWFRQWYALEEAVDHMCDREETK